MKVVELPTGTDDQIRVVAAIEDALRLAKAGQIFGVMVLWEGSDGFSYSRVNMSPLVALGLLDRVAYRVNKDYDTHSSKGNAA